MAGKPALLLYPDEWIRMTAALSPLAERLFLRLMLLGHGSPRYGFLVGPDGLATPPTALGLLTHCRDGMFEALLDELLISDVLSRTPSGIIFIPGMVRADGERKKTAERMRRHRERKGASHGRHMSVTSPSHERHSPIPPNKHTHKSLCVELEGGVGGCDGDVTPHVTPRAPPIQPDLFPEFALRIAAICQDAPAWFGRWARVHALRFGLRKAEDPDAVASWWPLFRVNKITEEEAEEASCWLLAMDRQPRGRPEHARMIVKRVMTRRKEAALAAERAKPKAAPPPMGSVPTLASLVATVGVEQRPKPGDRHPLEDKLAAFDVAEVGRVLTKEERRAVEPAYSLRFVEWNDRRSAEQA